MSKNKEFPSLWEMTKNFSKDVSKYIAGGASNVTEQVYKRRLEVCLGCEFYNEEKSRCTACGCLVEHKAKWKTSNCPKNKWKPQMLSYGKSEEGTDTDASDEA